MRFCLKLNSIDIQGVHQKMTQEDDNLHEVFRELIARKEYFVTQMIRIN